MVSRYNNRQVILGTLSLLLSILAYAVTAAFFYYGFNLVTSSFDLDLPERSNLAFASVMVIIVTIVGVIRRRQGMGYIGCDQIDPFAGRELCGGASYYVAYETMRFTGPAFVILQIALAGPFQMGAALSRFGSILPGDPGLERNLNELLEEVRRVDRWQDLSDYADRSEEMTILIRMGKVNFSPRKGRLRAAAD